MANELQNDSLSPPLRIRVFSWSLSQSLAFVDGSLPFTPPACRERRCSDNRSAAWVFGSALVFPPRAKCSARRVLCHAEYRAREISTSKGDAALAEAPRPPPRARKKEPRGAEDRSQQGQGSHRRRRKWSRSASLCGPCSRAQLWGAAFDLANGTARCAACHTRKSNVERAKRMQR